MQHTGIANWLLLDKSTQSLSSTGKHPHKPARCVLSGATGDSMHAGDGGRHPEIEIVLRKLVVKFS